MKSLFTVLFQTGRVLVFLFIFCVAGGHRGVMQVATWSQMAAANHSTFIDAVLGNPCEDCLTILEWHQKEKKDPRSTANAKPAMLAGELPSPLADFSPRVLLVLKDKDEKFPSISLPPAHGPPRAS